MLFHFPSEARLAIANVGEQSPRLLQANPTFPTFIDALALHLPPFVYGVCKVTTPAFPSLFIGELSLKSRHFLFSLFSYRKFLPKVEKSAKLCPA
jgi:hypothetical protein